MRKIILSVVLGLNGLAQAQELVFNTPIQLSSVINSNDEELAPILSPDGNTLYFIRAFHEANTGGKFAGTDIWMSKKDDQGQWMKASRIDHVWNNKRSNAVVGINAEENVVYLLNGYNNKDGIAFSKFLSGQWGQAEFIPIHGINRDDFVGFYVNPQFDVILISMKGKDTLGEEDLYISLKNSAGSWSEPRNLGPTINTSGFEISPFLSADKKRLFFSSNGHSGFGDADIYYCDRLFDSWETWSVPKNLGDKINSPYFDAYLVINENEVAFVSNKENKRSADIYTTHVSIKAAELVDRKYLSAKELAELIGAGVSNTLTFKNSEAVLSGNQRELLYFIANKLVTRTEIKILLTTFGLKGQSKLSTERVKNLMDELRLVGIDNFRVQVSITETDNPNDLNKIELRYFR
jgi:hypothetical protein